CAPTGRVGVRLSLSNPVRLQQKRDEEEEDRPSGLFGAVNGSRLARYASSKPARPAGQRGCPAGLPASCRPPVAPAQTLVPPLSPAAEGSGRGGVCRILIGSSGTNTWIRNLSPDPELAGRFNRSVNGIRYDLLWVRSLKSSIRTR